MSAESAASEPRVIQWGFAERLWGSISSHSRRHRAEIFHRFLAPSPDDWILDLGGDDGSHIASVVPGHRRVLIADIGIGVLTSARSRFGFESVAMDALDGLPFGDQSIDILFCSSVIEHVTVRQHEFVTVTSTREFAVRSQEAQRRFADEVRRVAKRYYIQTPYKFFPVETHMWVPFFVVWLPRPSLIRLAGFLNAWWPKRSLPDFYLLTKRRMRELFPDAELVVETFAGMPKSLIAIKS